MQDLKTASLHAKIKNICQLAFDTLARLQMKHRACCMHDA